MLPIYSIVLVGIVQVSQRHAWQSRSSVTLRLHVQRRGKLGTALLTEGSLRLNVSPISRSLFFVRQNYIIGKTKFDSNFSECFERASHQDSKIMNHDQIIPAPLSYHFMPKFTWTRNSYITNFSGNSNSQKKACWSLDKKQVFLRLQHLSSVHGLQIAQSVSKFW